MHDSVKDIKSVRTWFDKNHRYNRQQEVTFYTLSSITRSSVDKMMKDDMVMYPSFEIRRELLERIAPSKYKTNLRQKFHYITPEDLDNKKIIDIILFVVDYVLKAQSTNKKMVDDDTNSVRLPSKRINKIYQDTNLIFWSIRLAIHLQILEIGSAHETLLKKPRSFRIHPKHLTDPTNIIIKQPCLDRTIANNIIRSKSKSLIKKSDKKEDIYSSPVQLYSFYNLSSLKVDSLKAISFWKRERTEHINALDPNRSDYQQDATKFFMKYFSSIVAINRIEDNDRFLVRDRFGRIHSNLTNFPRLLRPYLSFNGCDEPLYQLDLSNSQPLLLVFLFQEYFRSIYGKNLGTTDKLLAFCQKRGIEDIPIYMDLVMSGRLYFELFRIKKKLKKQPNRKLTFAEKDDLKNLLFKLFFGRQVDIDRIKGFVDQFKMAFPTVWDIINHFKSDSHKDLSHMLQKTESGIFIDNVLRPLIVRNKMPHILSIHDCIVCPKGSIPAVKRQIELAFSKTKFKLKNATLKIEGLGEDHEMDESISLLVQ